LEHDGEYAHAWICPILERLGLWRQCVENVVDPNGDAFHLGIESRARTVRRGQRESALPESVTDTVLDRALDPLRLIHDLGPFEPQVDGVTPNVE